jgi:glyoxylase-like metal-dependent hydrolase (beta-lactamase superfamily II)
MKPASVEAFFDPETFSMTYVVWERATGDAVIIDPVINFDPTTQIITHHSINRLQQFVSGLGLKVHWILETHVHADHLSAARELKKVWPEAQWAMGQRVQEVFDTFKKLLAWPASLNLKVLGFDRLFGDGEEFTAGSLRLQAISTPGHTPACVTYRVGNLLFTGDALLMPDAGVGRCDFPGGSASALHDSIWGKLYALPDECVVHVGHDYQPGGRMLKFTATVGQQKMFNVHLNAATGRDEFVRFREARDKTLSAPRLIKPSLDWNFGAHQVVK